MSNTNEGNCRPNLAREGIKLLLNNHIEEAEKLFCERKDDVQMAAGYCFVTFMNALMTFEEEKLEEALESLRDIEKRCVQDIGWLKSVKNRVLGTFGYSDLETVEKLEEQIILADSQVCVALLTFLQQDLSSYVKGGWVLRKAWKVYQYTYTQVLALYKKTFGSDAVVPGSQFPSWSVVTRSRSTSSNLNTPLSPPGDWTVPTSPAQSCSDVSTSNGYRNPFAFFTAFAFPANKNEPTLDPELVARLMSAVSFGYGIFQLCVSMLPPSLLKLIHFLGFEGDRKIGVSALMFCREGTDMRAPLASLALLWYHTIVRPFYALDGSNVQAGVQAAQQLIDESQEEFGHSALFLFFKGRVHRLKCDIPAALEAYESAIEKSPQREVQLLCLHEVGWCYLIQLDWSNAYQCFNQLKNKSRWSQNFYTYLSVVCVGAYGDIDFAMKLAEEISDHEAKNALEIFLSRRIRKFPVRCHNSSVDNSEPSSIEESTSEKMETLESSTDTSSLSKSTEKHEIDQCYCKMLALELLYLWNTLPSCSPPKMTTILNECQTCKNQPMPGLCKLIEAAVYSCLRDQKSAIECFQECMNEINTSPTMSVTEGDEIADGYGQHVAAFALFEWSMILIRDPEHVEEGKALLTQAQNNYKNYDFENRLKIRIHSALRKLT